MSFALLTAVVLTAAPAGSAEQRSEAAAGLVLATSGPELAPEQRRALGVAASRLIRELTSLSAAEPVERERPCDDAACLKQLASPSSPLVLSLSAAVPNLVFELRAYFLDAHTGLLLKKTVRGGNPDAPEEAVRTLLQATLPGWTKKGSASIAISAPPDSVVKVDGVRMALAPLEDALAVPAGVHDVDVVFPDGRAVLWRRRLEEGARFHAEAATLAGTAGLGTATSERRGGSVLRPVGYGLFSAGALAIAGSLVAGGLAQQTSAQIAPCGVGERDCIRRSDADRLNGRAQRYADNANILAISGAVLGVAGAGVFAFDLVGSR